MTSPNTIIADMQLVETNLRQQIAHMNDEIAGLKSDVAYVEKQRDELLSVFGVVIDELETKHGNDGNAPGHGHEVAGVWDSDNGKLAGKPCGWCAVWAKAKDIRNSIASVKGGS